ncbi:right-handed parallel beta-helix repeat-containing protein [Sphingobium cupriresistens]|uniref:Right-handed parallel beta-helix repeat-containing protein n=1 Tax=Sphingobium cupriresistens TaxID=1132417 RepID=A0A8G1ZDP9_9SPHN|nr:right-handed parallel beta-helix repeat-containing protein [Sphingobium cupriresistens]RYM07989.1 right-handed parallel beta-helix repeat-containing protein [Sphingobium cupriresistens]
MTIYLKWGGAPYYGVGKVLAVVGPPGASAWQGMADTENPDTGEPYIPEASIPAMVEFFRDMAADAAEAVLVVEEEARFLVPNNIGSISRNTNGNWYPDGSQIPAVVGDRVLLVNQTDPRRNRLMLYNADHNLVPAPGYEDATNLPLEFSVKITDGARYAGQLWKVVDPVRALLGTDELTWVRANAPQIYDPNTFLAGPPNPTNKARAPEVRYLVPADLPRLKAHPSCLIDRDINDLMQGDVGRLGSYIDPSSPYDMRSAFYAASRRHRTVLIDVPEVYIGNTLGAADMANTTWIVYGHEGSGGVSIIQTNPGSNLLNCQQNMRFVGGLLRLRYLVPPTDPALKAILFGDNVKNVHFDGGVLLENCPTGIFLSGGNENISFGDVKLGEGCMGRAFYAAGNSPTAKVKDIEIARLWGASSTTTYALVEIDHDCEDIRINGGNLSGGVQSIYTRNTSGDITRDPRRITIRDVRSINTTMSGYLIANGVDIYLDHPVTDGNGRNGIYTTATAGGLTINSPRCHRAARDGININSTTMRRCTIIDPMCADNNQSNGVYGGIGIENGANNITIIGGSCGPSPDGTIVTSGAAAPGAHVYGVDIRGTNHRNIVVENVNCDNVVNAAGYRDQTTAGGAGTTNKLTVIKNCNIPGTAGPAFV